MAMNVIKSNPTTNQTMVFTVHDSIVFIVVIVVDGMSMLMVVVDG